MTLQSSGPISLEDLRKEFGGNSSEPVSFLKYYSGSAGNVSDYPLLANSDIPVSGSGSNISLSDFYGTINADRVTIGFPIPRPLAHHNSVKGEHNQFAVHIAGGVFMPEDHLRVLRILTLKI